MSVTDASSLDATETVRDEDGPVVDREVVAAAAVKVAEAVEWVTSAEGPHVVRKLEAADGVQIGHPLACHVLTEPCAMHSAVLAAAHAGALAPLGVGSTYVVRLVDGSIEWRSAESPRAVAAAAGLVVSEAVDALDVALRGFAPAEFVPVSTVKL